MMKLLKALVVPAAIATMLGMAGTAYAGGEAFLVCPSGHSGIATTVTSCPFAENVRYSYFTQGGPIVTAYSPVTDEYYTMQCQGGFAAQLNSGRTVLAVRCVGGNNAVVVLFSPQ